MSRSYSIRDHFAHCSQALRHLHSRLQQASPQLSHQVANQYDRLQLWDHDVGVTDGSLDRRLKMNSALFKCVKEILGDLEERLSPPESQDELPSALEEITDIMESLISLEPTLRSPAPLDTIPSVPMQAPAAQKLENGDDRNLDNTGYCLLSLDGGGVRGLSTLYILQSIMKRLNFLREEAGLRQRKPCEIFDLIGGTSTGGLIAIMLGHLEMSVEECLKAYTELMKHVFEKKENRSFISMLGRVKPRFSSQALEDAITKVIKERGLSINEKFENGSKRRCKVFVCTKFQKTNTITRLRNYRMPIGSDHHPTILEAALATSAAPTYFSDVAIEGSEFVDGAIGANNPAVQVEEEAADLWCENTGYLQPLVKCFISVGTGHPGIRSVSDKGFKNFLETLQKVATETEDTNQQFMGRWRDHEAKGRCFRFNVDHGLADVRLAEFEEQGSIKDTTAAYLDRRATKGMVSKCVENLRMKEYEPSPEFLRRLKEETLVQRPCQNLAKATPSEIAELIDLGNRHLKIPPDRITTYDLLKARQHFSQALHYRRNDRSTSPKQVARLCQKLLETSLGLSMLSRDPTQRKDHANQARDYGEAALGNVRISGDDCMVAQVEFLLGCVTVWRVYLQARKDGVQPSVHPGREGAEVLMKERLEVLRSFGNLDMEAYEAQAQKYLGYLTKPLR